MRSIDFNTFLGALTAPSAIATGFSKNASAFALVSGSPGSNPLVSSSVQSAI